MYFAILVAFSLSFLFVCVFLLLSVELGRCSSDLFLSSIPRTGLATTYHIVLGMVEARSVNVKKTTALDTQGDVAFSEYFLYHFRFLFVWRESTSYFLSFRMVSFYLVTTGWIFDISLCENSINQSIMSTEELNFKSRINN